MQANENVAKKLADLTMKAKARESRTSAGNIRNPQQTSNFSKCRSCRLQDGSLDRFG